MPDTTHALDALRHPAFARALDAGHAAAAAGQWSAAAARFTDAVDAADGADAAAAVALTNLGQALARAGRWSDAADALRRAAETREALVEAGVAAPAVAARGWSDVAALLAAAGPEDEARDALRRARARLGGADDLALHDALRETAALIGEEAPAFDAVAPLDLELPTPDVEQEQPAAPAAPAAPTASDGDETVDADWRPTPVFEADASDDDEEDLSALLALAAGPPVPEPATVELEAGDSLAAALDAAIEWTPTPAHALPAVAAAPAEPRVAVEPDDEDDLDAEPELLTPGVDFAELQTSAPAQTSGPRGQRLAAIDAIVELTEERQETKRGGLRGLLRKLTGR
ncbi:hypothetical protein [Roseisolibacter agri]|uniref:Tetratricopeptide repeat protein n=1 Tax=Roseisolibacter agri TaxID=2014610 RepID=A0AA37QF31_9BACT|nr:hypothetical protein [Roseisolibacter agri]GLC27681.1 hypothetical protein rosag_41940 [Roseisolibacter agri]